MKHTYCQCHDCRKARRKGLVLGGRTLKYLGSRAYKVSAYVRHHKYQRNRRRPED